MELQIGQLAKLVDVNLQTIRYYEREKLLPKPSRLPSGYRVYPMDSARRIRFIKRSQQLGFTLAEVRELLSLRVDAKRDRSDVRAIANAKVADIDAKIQALTAIRRSLLEITDHCKGSGPAKDCPILASLDSEQPLATAPGHKRYHRSRV
jgi:MerR family mercuric resistance operon transcriptional regulator